MAVYDKYPPLRESEFAPDAHDEQRATYGIERWVGQDEALRRRDRQVEENIRMLAGQQWMVWNPWLMKFIDVTEWMSDDERRWRQRPVINRLLYWFIITHSRMTENPPIITWQPSNSDRMSAMLAEVADTIHKSTWREAGMQEVIDRLVAWLIPSGRAHLQSVYDATIGDLKPWVNDAMLPILGPDGQPVYDAGTGQPAELPAEGVPYGPDGRPLAHYTTEGALNITGEPHVAREGAIRVDVMSALQVRGQWGPMPWHEKRWHMTRSFLTPEECWELFQQDIPADTNPGAGAGTNPGFLERVLFGTGYYGAATNKPGSEFSTQPHKENYVEVLTLWEKPCAFDRMVENRESPGGRLLVVARHTKRVLRDGPRPFRFRYTSGIRSFDFVNLPGRPSGTTPQEMLNGLQRTYNRFYAQIMENANLIANPIATIDQASGLQQVESTNKPGARYTVNKRPGVKAFEYVDPPALGRDVYQSHALLKGEMQDLGHIEGAEGAPPTEDPSGKLVRELRFNSDRFLGSPSRRMVEELARMDEDWVAIYAETWDEEKVIEYAGEDTIPRTLTVYPDLFRQGACKAVPDIESMLPESRGERQNKVFQLWQAGAWGLPQSPQAITKFLELARFPHIGRMAWPGGVHIVTAMQENGEFVRGASWKDVPVLDVYDDAMHLYVHETFMASPDYLKLPPDQQQNLAVHRQMHQRSQMLKLVRQARQQVAVSAAAGLNPDGTPAGGGGGGGGGGGESPPGPEPRDNPQGNVVEDREGA